ncbi:MAG TPA: winged helix-turn-helix domain-containing protein, partial [Pyrinomonadaceae bacterium]|nr:winged helix-turn-helix domain-containing protein [Pyrinomonadaceae bacterium]
MSEEAEKSLENSPVFLLKTSFYSKMSSNNQTFYRFKEFRLDAAERMLLRGTSSISLTPKAFDVLEILVERNGRLVEKDELLKLVWEDTFVEESNIARVVHSLRKILGEDAENKFIETVPKKGYRFVAEVEKINETNGFSLNGNHSHEIFENPQATKKIESVESEKFETTNKNRTKFAAFAAIFIFVFAVAGIWLYGNFRSKTDATKVPPQSRSIAVLPLKPLNSDARDSIYELGIAESLILKLSSAKDLTVRPLSATRKYQQLDQNPTDAGREQQVDLVLSSNYQLVNGKIRVTSQLIEVKSGNVEETFKTEKDSVDIFQMQDALANEIGSNLLTKLGNRENLLTISRITSNEEAYRLYLQAAFVFDQWNKTEMGTAIEYLERAVKLDPNFAEAYVYLGYAYRFTPGKYSGAPQEQFAKSKAAIEKALALKPNLAEAFAVSGMLKSSYESDFAGAEKDFKHALEINPSSPMALALYGNFLTIPGRFDEAIALNKKAQEIEPAAITHKINYGMLLYYSCRYNEAVT